jgi:hypothetical protein
MRRIDIIHQSFDRQGPLNSTMAASLVEMTTESSTAVQTEERRALFDGMDPDIMLKVLVTVPAEECIGNAAKKGFFKTYGEKWGNLKPDQKAKVQKFWQESLTEATRHRYVLLFFLLLSCLVVDLQIQRLLGEARTILAGEAHNKATRQAITTKHDRARLLHLRVDPSAAATWTAALRPLDVNHSGGDQVNMWARLAEMFNDYDTYKYTNAVIGGIDSLGLPLPIVGMEKLMLYCDDINPSSPNCHLRDALWIRTQYRELKTKITVCYSNYKRSGYQAKQVRCVGQVLHTI